MASLAALLHWWSGAAFTNLKKSNNIENQTTFIDKVFNGAVDLPQVLSRVSHPSLTYRVTPIIGTPISRASPSILQRSGYWYWIMTKRSSLATLAYTIGILYGTYPLGYQILARLRLLGGIFYHYGLPRHQSISLCLAGHQRQNLPFISQVGSLSQWHLPSFALSLFTRFSKQS